MQKNQNQKSEHANLKQIPKTWESHNKNERLVKISLLVGKIGKEKENRFRTCLDAEQRKDVISNFFIEIADIKDIFQWENEKDCRGYIGTTLYYKFVDACNKEKKVSFVDFDTDIILDTESLPNKQDFKPLYDAIKQLKQSDQYLIRSHYFEGKSLKEIAKETEQNVATVRKQHQRVKEKLEKMLKPLKNNFL